MGLSVFRNRRKAHPWPAAHDAARDRAAAQAWACRLLERGDWVIVDTETTGLDGAAEVVQLGVLAPDGAVLLDTLVRPQGVILPGAAAVHGLTERDLAAAPMYPQVHGDFCAAVARKAIIAYNASFDRRILAQTAARHRLDLPRSRWDCAMLQYARYVGAWDFRRGDYRWQRLPALPGGRAHRSITDCRATLEVIRLMAGA
jgi:DNA polymerase-3 subunit epsilon